MKRPIGVHLRNVPDDVAMRIMGHFGKRLKEWMDRKRMGLVDIAYHLRISYSYVAFLGKEKPYGRLLSPQNAVLLAELLEVDPDEVFSAMGQINPYLLEKVPPEVLERELLELHKRLRAEIKTDKKPMAEVVESRPKVRSVRQRTSDETDN
jgi:hypothetical protein